MEAEEQAADPLAGGIFQQGYQCGMLWGAALALGAESFRRTGNLDRSIPLAVAATRHVMQSFQDRTGTPDCEEITQTDWTKKWSILSYMIRGKMFKCFRLADHWAPELFAAAERGLAAEPVNPPRNPRSCAAMVIGHMGGDDSEKALVAGLAGGLGLSGGGCGALAAAMWKSTLRRVRRGQYKYSLSDPGLEKILGAFLTATRGEMECSRICGRSFDNLADHTEFLNAGGCAELIESLSKAVTE